MKLSLSGLLISFLNDVSLIFLSFALIFHCCLSLNARSRYIYGPWANNLLARFQAVHSHTKIYLHYSFADLIFCFTSLKKFVGLRLLMCRFTVLTLILASHQSLLSLKISWSISNSEISSFFVSVFMLSFLFFLTLLLKSFYL